MHAKDLDNTRVYMGSILLWIADPGANLCQNAYTMKQRDNISISQLDIGDGW